MAIGVYFTSTGMTTTKYAEAVKRLKQAGAEHPAGRSFHSSFGPPDQLMVFDVWTSQAAFEKFGKTLMPILESLDIKSNPPELMPIHKILTPPRAPAKRKTKASKKK